MFITILTPLAVVLAVLLVIVVGLVHQDSIESAHESVADFAATTSASIESLFVSKSDALSMSASMLGGIDPESPTAQDEVAAIAEMFLSSNKDLYCTWVVYEPEFFGGSTHYTKDFIREDDEIIEIFDLTDEKLDNEEFSPWYNRPLKMGETFFDNLGLYNYENGNGAVYTATISIPIVKDGKAVGVIGMDMLYDNMFDFIVDKHYHEAHTVRIVSEQGSVVYSENKGEVYKPVTALIDVSADEINETLEQGTHFDTTVYSFAYDGESYVYMYPIALQGASDDLTLLVEMPTSHLYTNANKVAMTILLLGLLSLVIMALFVYAAARYLSRPIKRITLASNEIASGNLNVKFDSLTANSPEIASLQSSLEKMVGQFQENIQVRKNFSASLEDKIAERTSELTEMTLQAQRAKEEAELAREEAEKTAEGKTLFLANMSHEIRTPMNAIMGMSELLLNDALTGRQRDYVRNIHVSSRSLLQIINDILDLSKLEFGKITIENASYDLPGLLDHICSMSAFLAGQKGLAFEFEVQGDLPKCQYGDSLRLKQVLVNIINNAIKYTKHGTVSLDVEVTGRELRFTVSDTGSGIREEDLKTLFDPFMQFTTGQSRKKGTGLGLSICQNLTELMDGSIDVESEFGVGSVFTITFPRVDGNECDIELDEVHETISAPDAKVLVVDDDQVNLAVAKGYLHLFDIEPDLASSGVEAIDRVRNATYDIILMDHMMPDMDGIETTKAIRDMGSPYEQLVIIALSANAVAGAKSMFIEAGMNDFLPKPIEMRLLAKMLDIWLPATKKTKRGTVLEESGEVNAHAGEDSALMRAARGNRMLDVDCALERMGGQVATYESVLRVFLKSTPDTLDKMQDALTNGDSDAFAILIHGSKSALASLGAFGYSESALKMEREARQGHLAFCASFFREYAPAIRRMIEELSPYIEADTVGEVTQGSDALLQEYAERLAQCVQGLDYLQAESLVQDMKAYDFGEEKNATIARIQDRIETFDWDGAAALIKTELR